jgi:hypothetical protein
MTAFLSEQMASQMSDDIAFSRLAVPLAASAWQTNGAGCGQVAVELGRDGAAQAAALGVGLVAGHVVLSHSAAHSNFPATNNPENGATNPIQMSGIGQKCI